MHRRWLAVGLLLGGAAATHGTLHAYDQQVPVMLLGAGISTRDRKEAHD